MKSAQALRTWVSLAVLLLGASQSFAYYNPTTGRWLSRDPIGERGSVALYVLAANQPTGTADRLGLDFPTWCGAGECYANWFGGTVTGCAGCPYDPAHLFTLYVPQVQILNPYGWVPSWDATEPNRGLAIVVARGRTQIDQWWVATRVSPCRVGACYCVSAVSNARILAWAVQGSPLKLITTGEIVDASKFEAENQAIAKAKAVAYGKYVDSITGTCVSKAKADCLAELVQLASRLYYAEAARDMFKRDMDQQGVLPSKMGYDTYLKKAEEAEAAMESKEAACVKIP